MNALRLYIAENYFKRNTENGLASSVMGLGNNAYLRQATIE